ARPENRDANAHRKQLDDEGEGRLVDLYHGLQNADADAHEERHQDDGTGNRGGHDHRIAQELERAVDRHRKLCKSDPRTRFQPSASTKRSSLMGKASVVGGTIIMPIDMSSEETARSTTRNGKSTITPI